MPFLFKSVQLGSPRSRGEGLRIGTARYLPRGVHKEDYAKLDYFDVWLPNLAPSRELLRQFKHDEVSLKGFFKKYRSEMKETDARQLIQLLAATAQRTPISVGCYCEDERQCHRSVLADLIRAAAGEPTVTQPLAEQCVYTIAHRDRLDPIYKDGGCGDLEEQRRWTTAKQLLADATKNGNRFAILFACATDCSQLIYRAILTKITIKSSSTHYSFEHLEPLAGSHSPQELVLLDTGRTIAPGFIRPYAICRTPGFLD